MAEPSQSPTDNNDAAQQPSTPVQPTAGSMPPQPPYGQQPYQPNAQQQYPQAGAQPQQAYQQAAQQPYANTQQPYQQTGAQQPYAQQPYQPAYPQQPNAQAAGAAAAQPKKVWPWILGGCIAVVVLLFVLGFVACSSLHTIAHVSSASSDSLSDSYSYSYPDSNSSDNNSYSTYTYTLEDIKSAAGDLANTVEDGRASAGVYQVGSGKDLEAGFYYFGGTDTTEGYYYVFDLEDGATDAYTVEVSIAYFGHYYGELEEGDVVVYIPGDDDSRMYLASSSNETYTSPYGSGLYRVGTDIPAGTYTVAVDANVTEASQDFAVYVMTDLDFDSDSFVDTQYLLAGQEKTVTVEEGQLLELYGATATPASE